MNAATRQGLTDGVGRKSAQDGDRESVVKVLVCQCQCVPSASRQTATREVARGTLGCDGQSARDRSQIVEAVRLSLVGVVGDDLTDEMSEQVVGGEDANGSAEEILVAL